MAWHVHVHVHVHAYAYMYDVVQTFSRKSKSAMLRLVILIRWYLAAIVSRAIASRAIVSIALGGQVMPRYAHTHMRTQMHTHGTLTWRQRERACSVHAQGAQRPVYTVHVHTVRYAHGASRGPLTRTSSPRGRAPRSGHTCKIHGQ